MKVKYDIPVEEVHQRSAISIIKASGSLDVFACVNSSKDQIQHYQLSTRLEVSDWYCCSCFTVPKYPRMFDIL
jgi:hypothetical protein